MATIDIINNYTDTVKNMYQFHFDESFYKKNEIDILFSDFSDNVVLSIQEYFLNYYNKTEINNKFNNYYKKYEVDNIILKFNNYYTKNEINNILSINDDDIILKLNFLVNNFYDKNVVNKKILNFKDKKENINYLFTCHINSIKLKINEILKNYVTKEEINNTVVELDECYFDDIIEIDNINILLTDNVNGSISIQNMNILNQNSVVVLDDSHYHNVMYYLKDDIDYYLGTKSDINHNHDDIYFIYTDLLNFFNNKSNINHNHSDRYYIKNNIDNAFFLKSDIDHHHNTTNGYYEKQYIDNQLSFKSDIVHDHDERYYNVNSKYISEKIKQYYLFQKGSNQYNDQLILYLNNIKSKIGHNHDNLYSLKTNIRGF